MGESSINVETNQLTEFATKVRHDAGHLLRTDVSQADASLRDGVTFGTRNVSGSVLAAKQRYAQSLQTARENLQQFIQAAEALAGAAEQVATQFDAVDARSADAVGRVHHLLDGAVREADAARVNRERQHGPGQAADYTYPKYGPYTWESRA